MRDPTAPVDLLLEWELHTRKELVTKFVEWCMTGPKIYTEAWERLRVAGKDTETRQPAELQQTPDAPGEP